MCQNVGHLRVGAEVIKKWMLWETMRTKREAFSTVYSESFDNDPKHKIQKQGQAN